LIKDQTSTEERKGEQTQPEQPGIRERAEEVSERWGEVLEDFRLPCPMGGGTMQAQGVVHNRLYEFQTGEPGAVNPVEVLSISFVCTRCGYTTTFDAKMFKPACVAQLEGVSPEECLQMTRPSFGVLLPLRGGEDAQTFLDLATAIAAIHDGDVLAFSIASNTRGEESLARRVRNYEPRLGAHAPFLALRRGGETVKETLDETLSHFESDLILVDAHAWFLDQERELANLLSDLLKSSKSDIGIVYNRGLESVGRVLLATSGGPNAQAAAPLVLDVLKAFDAQLEVLYVADPEEREEVGLSRISDTFAGLDVTDVEVEKQVILSEQPIQTIRNEAADSDLLILGASRADLRGTSWENSFANQVAEGVDITTVVVLSRGGGRRPWLKQLLLGTE